MLNKILIWLGLRRKPPVVIDTEIKVTVSKKGKKKYKTYVPKCSVTHKICHREHNAKDRARRGGIGVKLRAYKCEFCPSWHITHKKNKLTFH